MHKITKEFLDNIEQEKTQGRNFFEYELIEEYRKFYAKWQGRRLEYEYKRKPLRANWGAMPSVFLGCYCIAFRDHGGCFVFAFATVRRDV